MVQLLRRPLASDAALLQGRPALQLFDGLGPYGRAGGAPFPDCLCCGPGVLLRHSRHDQVPCPQEEVVFSGFRGLQRPHHLCSHARRRFRGPSRVRPRFVRRRGSSLRDPPNLRRLGVPIPLLPSLEAFTRGMDRLGAGFGARAGNIALSGARKSLPAILGLDLDHHGVRDALRGVCPQGAEGLELPPRPPGLGHVPYFYLRRSYQRRVAGDNYRRVSAGRWCVFLPSVDPRLPRLAAGRERGKGCAAGK